MENLSQFVFGLAETVKKTIKNDSSVETADDITKRKALIYGKMNSWHKFDAAHDHREDLTISIFTPMLFLCSYRRLCCLVPGVRLCR